MPADITLNAGSGGAIIATDPTTSSEHYQLIKLAQGAVGTFTLVTTANALPVVIGSSFQGGITSLSSQITVTATGPVTVTSGTITSTAATNPWSSAPGFNVPVVNASSGLVQISGTPTVVVATSAGLTQTVTVLNASSGLVQVIPIGVVSSLGYVSTYFQSTGGAASVSVRSSASSLMGYSLFNSTAAIRSVKIYNTTSAPTVGSTTNVLLILMAPGSTGGGGANLMFPSPGLFTSNGIGFTMTANVAGTDTGAPGSNDLTLNLYIV